MATPVITRRASLREVAEAAGVSVMTVSNVINGKKNVSEETRRRVDQVIRESGYRPVQAARSLRTSERKLIGLLIVDDSRTYLEDQINGTIASSINNFLTTRGFHLVLEHTTTADIDQVGSFHCQILDSMIVLASGGRKTSEIILRRLNGMPSIFVQSPLDTTRDGVTIVNQDDRAGGILLAEHLAGRGARSAMILGTQLEWHAFRQRRDGLDAGFAAYGVEPVYVEAEGDHIAQTVAATDRFLDQHPLPDAVIGLNDSLALGAMRSLSQRGLVPPRDVRIASFNRLEMIDFVTPRITAVRSVPHALGQKAAELALQSITPAYRPAGHMLPVELDIGETS